MPPQSRSKSNIKQNILPTSRPRIEAFTYPQKEHKISRKLVDGDAQRILLRLQDAGFKAYIVGGGVRDLLLDKTPKDFDISTEATPREIKSLFRNSRVIGRRFKLVHIFFSGGKAIEVSTFRDSSDWSEQVDSDDEKNVSSEDAQSTPDSDVETLAADNTYGDEYTDAFRRDITVNGLFLDVSTMEIIDYVGGMNDLRAGIVRVIGQPDVRFAEDPVRMIRAVRHAARNGFQIEKECWKSLLVNAEKISSCPGMRIYDEIKKDFSSGCFLTILNLLGETGLLDHIIPELLENNKVLLSSEGDFCRCVELLDEQSHSGAYSSSTAMLAVIAMFTGGDSIWLRDIEERIPEGSELSEQFRNSFTRLPVPRKERERVHSLLHLWQKVKWTPKDKFKVGSLKRNSLLADLCALLAVTTTSRDDQTKLNQLLVALDEGFEHQDEFQYAPSHRAEARGRRRQR